MRLWGGRFAGRGEDPLFEAFSESFTVDQRLVLYEIQVNRAYVSSLGEAGVLRAGEVRRLRAGLEQLRRDIERRRDWSRGESSEDVHTWIEARLKRKVGPLAGKLRTGRSRNDLIATSMRMFVKDAARKLEGAALGLMESLMGLARRHVGVVMPGYTHLQPAQPVLFSHYLLAYFEMFARDVTRLEDCRERADELPLGSGALAGSAMRIDRRRLARALGFERVTRNSIDATSDRDFICELLFDCSLALTHLSRLAEDLVIFSSPGFGYVEVAATYSTGSSLMPQKKNPDALELIRGKAARGLGKLTTMLALLKGLPLGYNRDLQEDKAALFDGVDSALDSLLIAARVVETLRVDAERMRARTAEGFLTATDLAEELVRRGVPFAKAHRQVGKLVRHCVDSGKTFDQLSRTDARRFVPGWDGRMARVAERPEASVARRRVIGGTAPRQVARQIAAGTRLLESLRMKVGDPIKKPRPG